MPHTRSPLSATARRLFNSILELYSERTELNVESNFEERWIVVSRMTEFGPLVNPRLCITAEGGSIEYRWQVWFKTIAIKVYFEELRPHSGYTVCPGLKKFGLTQSMYVTGLNRIDAQSCALWHIPHNVHHHTGDELRDCLVVYCTTTLAIKAASVSSYQKLARTSVHSSYPLKYLSPKSKSECVSKLSKERKNLAAKLSSLTDLEYDLNDKQHVELLEIVRSVNHKESVSIEELCFKGDQLLSSECNPLREAWRQDVTVRLQYERDQRKNGAISSIIDIVVYTCLLQHQTEVADGV